MICRGFMFEHGIIMRAVGDRMIIAPPLVTTRAQIDEMTAKIGAALDATLAELTQGKPYGRYGSAPAETQPRRPDFSRNPWQPGRGLRGSAA